jgi:hypothetical protein
MVVAEQVLLQPQVELQILEMAGAVLILGLLAEQAVAASLSFVTQQTLTPRHQ